MKRLLLTLLTGLSLTPRAEALTNPTYAFLRIYGAAVSTSPLCTNPVVLFDSSSPKEVNMYEKPTIGGGNVPDGTYNCVIMKISDTIRFRPSANDGSACRANTEYNLDICRSGTSSLNPLTGSAISCTGSTLNAVGSDIVYVYISTASTDTAGTGNSLTRPTSNPDGSRGMRLENPFIVSGSSAGRFVMDLTNKVDGTGSAPDCDLQPPAFRFR